MVFVAYIFSVQFSSADLNLDTFSRASPFARRVHAVPRAHVNLLRRVQAGRGGGARFIVVGGERGAASVILWLCIGVTPFRHCVGLGKTKRSNAFKRYGVTRASRASYTGVL